MKRMSLLAAVAAFGFLFESLRAGTAAAPEIKILLPLGRTAYQTNERIDVSVVRSSAEPLPEGRLTLTVTGEDGSRLDLAFPVKAAEGRPATATENLHLNAALLRPGKYTLDAAADGASARTEIDVHSHLRKSSFRLIDWASHASRREQALLGEDSMGFNTLLTSYGGTDVDEMIRGGLDYLVCCNMGGWHYMDLRRECDWSDPYVLGGGIARASRQTFKDRTTPNCLGEHFYDEPLLAEVKDPADPGGKRLVRHGVPAQERSYRSAFGREAPRIDKLDLKRPEDLRRWMEYNRWRLLLLEAAWKLSGFSVEYVRPDYLTSSQTQWAWQAYDCGYYFNVNRPFSLVNRHALYDYKYGGDFSPGFAFEFGRIRDLAKPNWYLPMWGSGHNDLYRAEQYLSFMNNLQGLAKPPDLLAHRPSKTAAAQAIVESNQLAARLGTVFTTLPVTRSETAVLYSMSNNLHEPARESMESYRGNAHFQKLLYLYIASKMLHVPLFPVVDEDVLDGSLAAHHKAILLAGVDYLDPKVLAALEGYIAGGGKVLVSDDSKVTIKGAASFPLPLNGVKLNQQMDQWAGTQAWDRWSEAVMSNAFFHAAVPVAEALGPKLAGLGVKPVFDCDQPGVIASRQAQGDIEYLFAVNASPDPDAFGWYFLKSAVATIGVPADGRPIYDALNGGAVEQFSAGAINGKLTGTFRFGPGQMRVFARAARPIGGLQVLTPVVFNDYTAVRDPLRVEVNAVVVDDRKQVLSGSAPLRIEVTDPLAVKRYELYRATDHGLLKLSLPLAVNDPAGAWTVSVRELLSNRAARAVFTYQPPSQCGALAGATRRSMSFGRDRDNVFRFFRTHKELTIIKGTSKLNDAAAERLKNDLGPWDIHCKILAAGDVKRRALTAAEKPTWVDAGGAFDVREPVVLLGNPDDSPLIRHLQDQQFLPYKPVRDQFPGRGRSLIAWQRDGLAYFGHESLTLIAYDEPGMAEAVGTAYEIAAGLEPLTPLILPEKAQVTPATRHPEPVPTAAVAWRRPFPDRVARTRTVPGGVVVLTEDGTLGLVKPDGNLAWQKTFNTGEFLSLDASPDGSLIAVGAGNHLHAFDGQGKPLFDRSLAGPESDGERPEGISAVAVAPTDGRIFVISGSSLHTGNAWNPCTTLRLFDGVGKPLWSVGGKDEKTNQPQLPDRYRFGAFSPDGKKIVVLTDKKVVKDKKEETEKKAYLLDAADGRIAASIDGFNAQATVLGDHILLSDGEGKVALVAPDSGKVVGQLDCGKTEPVAFAASPGGVIIGTEADGGVRLVKAIAGKLDEQTLWKNEVYTKIVKSVSTHDGRVAATYWGGTLRVFDGDGKLEHEHVFPEDISALAWAGDRLVVGLTSGELIGLQMTPARPGPGK